MFKIKIRSFILLFFILLVTNVNATDPKILINEANSLYAKNDFDEAIKKYQLVLNSGHVTAGLYFNLGNAYYKTHNLKNAILFYERARLLDPADKDIELNLELAHSQTFDKIETIPDVFFVTWFKWLENRFSKDLWALISVISFIACISLFLIYLLSRIITIKVTSFYVGIIFLVISISSYIFGYQLNKIQLTHNKAIIFTPTVIVKSSPSDTGTNLFIIHEGTKVEIIDKIGNWSEIKIADGSRGWIMETDMQII